MRLPTLWSLVSWIPKSTARRVVICGEAMVVPLLVIPYLCLSNAELVAASCWVCGCGRWVWRRLRRHGSVDSETWPPAEQQDVQHIQHYCNLALGSSCKEAVQIAERTLYVKAEQVVTLVNETRGSCPPHYTFLDEERREIVLCIRGLHLAERVNYKTLADTSKGSQPFDGGYVHRGLLTAAQWLLENEAANLKQQLETHPDFVITVVGHSLGAGVASLFALLLVNHPQLVGGVRREQVRCYCIAPARSMSLNLAIRYADVINSVVLQDDFLPRTSTPIVKIFLLSSIVFTSLVLCWRCVVDTFVSEEAMLKDPKRLYPPGRLFHITYKEPCCCCCSFPRNCQTQTAVPVEGRFERLVISRTVTSDHHILVYKKYSQKAAEEAAARVAPPVQVMSKSDTLGWISCLERDDPNQMYATVALKKPPGKPVL